MKRWCSAILAAALGVMTLVFSFSALAEYEEEYEYEAEYEITAADFDALLEAEVGDLMWLSLDGYYDAWYKFDEDERNIYLLYGNYYPANKLYFGFTQQMIQDTGLTTQGIYGLTFSDWSSGFGDRLVNYLRDEYKWSTIRESLERAFPMRTIVVTGAPTMSQLEGVMSRYPDKAYVGSAMLNPYITEIDGCSGWWLATKMDPAGGFSPVYSYHAVGGVGDDLWSTDVNAARPLAKISKDMREATPEEIQEAVQESANSREGEVVEANNHILHYGKYESDADGASESYTLGQDGTLLYESEDYTADGEYYFAFDDMDEPGGEMMLHCYFNDGGRDFLHIPADDTLEDWTGQYFVFIAE